MLGVSAKGFSRRPKKASYIALPQFLEGDSALRRISFQPHLVADDLRPHQDDQLALAASSLRCCLNRSADDQRQGADAQGSFGISTFSLLFCSRPPITTTWPLRARTMESD